MVTHQEETGTEEILAAGARGRSEESERTGERRRHTVWAKISPVKEQRAVLPQGKEFWEVMSKRHCRALKSDSARFSPNQSLLAC